MWGRVSDPSSQAKLGRVDNPCFVLGYGFSYVARVPKTLRLQPLSFRSVFAPSRRDQLSDYFVGDAADTSHNRLISAATYPAPNPLSIFTTLTFEAHEFIIPNNAATP